MSNLNTLFLAANGGAAGNNVMMILLFVILIGFTYFGMIRPQKKQQQKRMQMMDQLKKGDKVILIDGLHAKVDSINNKDQTIVVDADGIYLTFSRMAVRQIIPAAENAEGTTTEKVVEEKTAQKESASVKKSNDSEKSEQKADTEKGEASSEDNK